MMNFMRISRDIFLWHAMSLPGVQAMEANQPTYRWEAVT